MIKSLSHIPGLGDWGIGVVIPLDIDNINNNRVSMEKDKVKMSLAPDMLNSECLWDFEGLMWIMLG